MSGNRLDFGMSLQPQTFKIEPYNNNYANNYQSAPVFGSNKYSTNNMSLNDSGDFGTTWGIKEDATGRYSGQLKNG